MYKERKKQKNRRNLINARLRQSEDKMIALYLRLETIVNRLKRYNYLQEEDDFNFDDIIYVYSDNKMLKLINQHGDNGQFKLKWYAGMHLYIENAEYRESWNTTSPDSGGGWASPLWDSLRYAKWHYNIPDNWLMSVTKGEVGIKIDYQVMVELNFSYRHKISDDDKICLMNQKLKEAEERLWSVIQSEQEKRDELYRLKLLDKHRITQKIELFTRNKDLNEDADTYWGNPFFEHDLDWISLYGLKKENDDWVKNRDEIGHHYSLKCGEPYCYSMATVLLGVHGRPSSAVSKTDNIWLEYTVEYLIDVDFTNKIG